MNLSSWLWIAGRGGEDNKNNLVPEFSIYFNTVGFQEAQWQRSCLPMQEVQRRWFESWIRKIPWRRKWHPAPVFLPGKFHGQRNLVGYSAWGHKELDRTEQQAWHGCIWMLYSWKLRKSFFYLPKYEVSFFLFTIEGILVNIDTYTKIKIILPLV